ncbi:vWA domain-containing protein [Aestuariimicrobium kwangyangense]|uniref:vWA domain-containing protein n=1 Tax=Aestuariimicrobium kwangyangense TaxID=396389 RepID=UPI0003B5F3A1|nr:vWA domain-containing protein [Aestuariimicrobium kwangyangense]
MALTMLFAAPSVGHADQLSDLAGRVGVATEPTDYVLLVDTSASMKQDGRWGRVRQALGALAGQLGTGDRVTMITFDDGVRSTWQAAKPSSAQVLAHLPKEPTGKQTDIGAAIDAGVTALAKSRKVGALVLLTDGEIDASPSSKYPNGQADSWDSLRTRAAKAIQGRQVGAFAVSIGGKTDARLLTSVFPKATVADPADIVGYLAGITRELTKVRVAQALAADLKAPVSVVVDHVTPDPQNRVGSPVTARVHLSSSATRVPVTISGFSVSGVTGATATVDPASVDLQPGASSDLTLTITGLPAGGSTITLAAKLSSPWQTQLAAAGLKLPSSLSSGAVTVTAPEASAGPTSAAPSSPSPETQPSSGGADVATTSSSGIPAWLPLAGGGAMAALVLVGIVLAVLRGRRPALNGSLAILSEGRVVDEILLDGPSATTQRGHTKLQVSASRNGSISVKGKEGARGFATVLTDEGEFDLGEGRTLRYTAQRTRMLDMVQN